MTTLLIWLAGTILTGPFWAYACYTGRWDDGPRKPGSVPVCNIRWATFMGIVMGASWFVLIPLLIVLYLGLALIDWMDAGGKPPGPPPGATG